MLMLDTMDFNNFRKLPTLSDETASPPGTQPTLAQPVPSRSTNSREDDLLICDVCSYATNKSEKFALHLVVTVPPCEPYFETYSHTFPFTLKLLAASM